MNKFYKDYVLANPCALNDEDIDKLVSHCEKQIMLGYELNDRKHKEEHETTLKIINEYKRLKQENKELHNKIDKAIEYIEEFPLIHYSSTEKIEGKRLSGKLVPVDELLEILKGDVNE